MGKGENRVRIPEEKLSWALVEDAARRLLHKIEKRGEIRIVFHTPTRLVENKSLVKMPDFSVFFRRLLQRIDGLNIQHSAGERRSKEDIQRLHALADSVRLVDACVDWRDLWAASGSRGHTVPMSGFTGYAVYRSKDWEALLPWLVLGQGVQVGKLTVKGNGVFSLHIPGETDYWKDVFERNQ
jgi:hypothetical protein